MEVTSSHCRGWIAIICLVVLLLPTELKACQVSCNHPLGFQSGHIRDYQLSAMNTYNDDDNKYGAHLARLNGLTGYRAKQHRSKQAWVIIDLEKPTVVTEISIQGYGDNQTSEWVTEFSLFYTASVNTDYQYFKNQGGGQARFQGNKDRSSVRHNKIPMPAVATRIMIIPQKWSPRGVGLRMELYGCNPGYAFNVWIMMSKTDFTGDFFDNKSEQYINKADQIMSEVNGQLKLAFGFLSAQLIRFSPHMSASMLTLPVAEIKINCLPKKEEFLTGKLELLRKSNPKVIDASFLGLQYTHKCDCPPPKVKLRYLDKTTKTTPALLYVTSMLYTLEGDVEIDCTKQKKLLVSWELSQHNSGLQQFEPITIVQKISSNTKLRTRVAVANYRDKLLYVRCKVQIIAVRGAMSYDYGFLKFVTPSLVAKITGRRRIVKNNDIVLDGSSSFDPLLARRFRDKYLKFAWFCRMFDEIFPLNHTSNVDISQGKGVPTRGGCYGYRPGKLNSSKRKLRINTKLMNVGDYVFTLTVSKKGRKTSTSNRVKVLGATSINIRCSNCVGKIPSHERVSFAITCNGTVCPREPTYKWRVYQQTSLLNQWVHISNIDSKTEQNDTQFIIENFISPLQAFNTGNNKFKVDVVLLDSHVVTATDHVQFVVNGGPRLLNGSGGCYVNPFNGIGISTVFVLFCHGWHDEDVPLSYQFNYHGEFGTLIFHSGANSNASTTLPPGQARNDFILKIEVIVSDSLGGETKVSLMAKVRPSYNLQDFQKRYKSFTESASLLVQKGETDSTAEKALSLIQTAERILEKESDQVKLKNTVLASIQGIRLHTLPQISKVVAIVALATRQRRALNEQARELAITLLQRSTSALAKWSQAGEGNLNIARNISTTVLRGIERIMMSSTTNNNSEAKNDTKLAIQLAESVAETLLFYKRVGDPPSVIKTETIDILVYRARSEDLGGKKITEGNSGVQLPSAKALFGNSGSIPSVDFQMIMHARNPYTWDSGSSFINSGVVDITLKRNSEKIHVSNLNEPVVVIIPQTNPKRVKTDDQSPQYFIKPSNGSSNIRYHSFNIESELHTFVFKIVPQQGKSFEVFISSAKRRANQKLNFTKTIPDFTQCDSLYNGTGNPNCNIDPYMIRITSEMTGKLGLHYLGIRHLQENSTFSQKNMKIKRSTNSVFLSREKRECTGSKKRKKRSCVEMKDPPTIPPPTPVVIVPLYDSKTDVNYTLSTTVSFCGYWSGEKDKWTTEGCKIGTNSNTIQFNCLCNHLSAFGGDLFVAPNPIDFDKVFLEFGRLGETGNFVVLSTVCVLWALYFVGIILARKADRMDKKKVVMQVLSCEEECSSLHRYKISIETGMWYGNGTSADVSIVLYGSQNSSGPIQLTNTNSEKYFFSRSSVNNFYVELPFSLGILHKVKIQHNNKGSDPSWFLKDIFVVDFQTDVKWHFQANRWIAVHKSDGRLDCTLQETPQNGKLNFKGVFHARLSKKMGESHLWISIFSRPPHNPFTRCQRFSCCMSILFAAMVTNAMFYRFGIDSKDTIYIGSLKISWTEIKIGMQSALIAVPVNILIVMMFKNIKTSSKATTIDGIETSRTSTRVLPPFFLFVTWATCMSVAAVSSIFVVFYSLTWGASTSNQWLKSIMISFVEDACLIQPVKIVAVAIVLSLIFRRPDDHDCVDDSPTSMKPVGSNSPVPLPSTADLEKSRQKKSKMLQLTLALVDIALFAVFVVLLVIVVYGNRDDSRFRVTDSLKKSFKGFEKIRNVSMFWRWTRTRFLSVIYNVTWYNAELFDGSEGFIGNKKLFLVGMPRLRQIRVKSDFSCLEDSTMTKILHFKRCISPYTAQAEETSRYNLIGWTPIKNASKFHSEFQFENVCPRPWRYKTAKELEAWPISGGASLYYGGGFVADLGYNLRTAKRISADLQQNKWTDNLTAAVLLEFTVFEPHSQLFSSVKLLCERLPTGGVNLVSKFDTIPVYFRRTTGSTTVSEICQPLLMLVVLVLFFIELVKIFKHGLAYLKEIWNWLSFFQCFGAMATVVIFFFKQKFTTAYVKRIDENPYETTSSDTLVFWSEVEMYVLSFVIFVTTVKGLRIIRFNRHVSQMMCTLKVSGRFLSSYMASFIVLILGFTTIANTCFGTVIPKYSTFFRSVGSLLQQIVGGRLHFTAIRSVDPLLGPMFSFSYIFLANFILVNMFIAILNECYASVRCADHTFLDAELGDLFISLLKNMREKAKRKGKHLIQSIGYGKTDRYNLQSKGVHNPASLPAFFEDKVEALKESFSRRKIFKKLKGSYSFKIIEDKEKGYFYQAIPNENNPDNSEILGISYRQLPNQQNEKELSLPVPDFGKKSRLASFDFDINLDQEENDSVCLLASFDSDISLDKEEQDEVCLIKMASKKTMDVADYNNLNMQMTNIRNSFLDIKKEILSVSWSSLSNQEDYDSAFDNSSHSYWDPFSDSGSNVFHEDTELFPCGNIVQYYV